VREAPNWRARVARKIVNPPSVSPKANRMTRFNPLWERLARICSINQQVGSPRVSLCARAAGEFAVAAVKAEKTMQALCAQYETSRTTRYLWMKRYRESGVEWIAERSRRQKASPGQTA